MSYVENPCRESFSAFREKLFDFPSCRDRRNVPGVSVPAEIPKW